MRFLLIFIILIFLIGRLFRFIFKRWISKISQQGHNNTQQQQTKKEGEVTIDANIKEKKMYDQSVGDYIDYEETK